MKNHTHYSEPKSHETEGWSLRDLWLDSNEMSDEQGSYDRISKYSGAKSICQPPVVQVVPIKKTRDCKRERDL